MNIDMADIILEWTLEVSGYANTFISRGEIIIFRGESVRNKWKTRKNIGFIQQENVTKSSYGPPFGTFSRGK